MRRESEDKIKEMAKLLLSKATMLQYHCPECGSPLFKDGRKIFCPNCGQVKVREEKPAKEGKTSPGQGLLAMKGRRVCVKTASDVYRGVCEDIDATFLTLSEAENLIYMAKHLRRSGYLSQTCCLSKVLK